MSEAILILDNNKKDRELLSNILSAEYDVIQTDTADKAFDVLLHGEKRIAAVIVDIVMPEKDGFSFLEKMSAYGDFNKIPVLVVSSSEDENAEIKALEYGVADYLTKPFSAKSILHRIKNNLDRVALSYRLSRMELDPLTQVYNLDAFYRYAKARIESSPKDTKMYAIVSNFRNFKMINSKYGFYHANKLLKIFAHIARQEAHKFGDIIGRISGDNFAGLVSQTLYENREAVYNTIFSKMLELISEKDFNFNCGIYEIEDKKEDINKIFDRALFAARIECENKFCFYSEELNSIAEEEKKLVRSFKESMKGQNFSVLFQPKYDIENNKLIGAEALVRWEHPEYGKMSPSKFIPIFEKNGLIGLLDVFVWEEVCKEIKKCKEKGLNIPPISINVSRKDLFGKDFISNVEKLLEKYRILPSDIHLEITETSYTENQTSIKALLKKLIDKGFYLEMDDFGSGYSSLNMLNEIEFNMLKLDVAFIKSLTNKNKISLIPYIMDIAKALGKEVLVEGVETSAQLEVLKKYGCRYAQGYLFAKPLTAKDFEALLGKDGGEEWKIL